MSCSEFPFRLRENKGSKMSTPLTSILYNPFVYQYLIKCVLGPALESRWGKTRVVRWSFKVLLPLNQTDQIIDRVSSTSHLWTTTEETRRVRGLRTVSFSRFPRPFKMGSSHPLEDVVVPIHYEESGTEDKTFHFH